MATVAAVADNVKAKTPVSYRCLPARDPDTCETGVFLFCFFVFRLFKYATKLRHFFALYSGCSREGWFAEHLPAEKPLQALRLLCFIGRLLLNTVPRQMRGISQRRRTDYQISPDSPRVSGVSISQAAPLSPPFHGAACFFYIFAKNIPPLYTFSAHRGGMLLNHQIFAQITAQ